MNSIRPTIQMLRPKQWVKNVIVFAPLFFSSNLFNTWLLTESLVAFVAFCLLSSGVYCLNDIHDCERDRRHPSKRLRPLAAGLISKTRAWVMSAMLTVTAFLTACIVSRPLELMAVLAAYLVMNIAYTLYLKQIAILDVVIIATGFILRLLAGNVATGVPLSHWIVIITFMVTLLLAFGKRRGELVLAQTTKVEIRSNIGKYSLKFIDAACCILSAIIILAYFIYTISPEIVALNGKYFYISGLIVLVAILGFCHRIMGTSADTDPTELLLKDRFIGWCIIIWVVFFAVTLYWK